MRIRPKRKRWSHVWILVVVLVTTNLVFGLTGTNVVPISIAGTHQRPITANDLKPIECVDLNLTRVVGGSLVVDGNAENDLLLGSENIDLMDGREGDDCIVGGPNDDSLTGGPGIDVCIGGLGTDAFMGCETQIQ